MLELELLQVAIGRRSKLSKTPSNEEWDGLYSFAEKQALIGVLWGGIERLPKEQTPYLDLLMDWLGQTEYIKSQNEILNCRSAEITKKFKEDGYRSVVIKGQANASYYPKPEMRTTGDVDLWVEGDRDVLIEMIRKRCKPGRISFHHIHYRYFEDVDVEVHFFPTVIFNYFGNKRLQYCFSKYADICFDNWIQTSDDHKFCTLTNVSNFMMQIGHMYRHAMFEGIGLRHFVDLYYLLIFAKFTESEKNLIVQYIKKCKLKKFTSAVMWVLKEIFLSPDNILIGICNEKEGKILLKEIMIGGNFGKYNTNYQNKHTSKLQSFMYLTYQNFRWFNSYPSDCLWYVIYRIAQYCWRKYKGY